MKIVVDFDLCESHGVCVKVAPAVFALDEQEFLQVLQETPPEELRAVLEQAVARCPRAAIRLIDP